jgi:hypothetical protein
MRATCNAPLIFLTVQGILTLMVEKCDFFANGKQEFLNSVLDSRQMENVH